MKIFFLITFIIILFILFHSETMSTTYATKQNALDDKAIKRGWIPDILPNSAFNIHETHNLDTNKVNGSFNYNEMDEKELLKKLNNKHLFHQFDITIDKAHKKVTFSNNDK